MNDAVRIAMWSGPRNISTTLLRSWGARPDTFVCDEPLYAHYLLVSGAPHPGREEIIASHEADWRRVADWLTGPAPEGRTIFYQKHMAKHLLPDVGRGWLDALTHAFLILIAACHVSTNRDIATTTKTHTTRTITTFV